MDREELEREELEREEIERNEIKLEGANALLGGWIEINQLSDWEVVEYFEGDKELFIKFKSDWHKFIYGVEPNTNDIKEFEEIWEHY